jgi:hypothetical protein
MREIPRSKDLEPGTWMPSKAHKGAIVPVFVCPDCASAQLLDEHKVGSDGLVTPIVICNAEHCTFEHVIQLMTWYGTATT